MYQDRLYRADSSREPRRDLRPSPELSGDVILDSGWLTTCVT